MVAALAAPHRGHEPDDVTANHALILLLRQLFNKTPCLRLFALWYPVPVPLTLSVVLMMTFSPPSSRKVHMLSRASSRVSLSVLKWFNVAQVFLTTRRPL